MPKIQFQDFGGSTGSQNYATLSSRVGSSTPDVKLSKDETAEAEKTANTDSPTHTPKVGGGMPMSSNEEGQNVVGESNKLASQMIEDQTDMTSNATALYRKKMGY